VSPGECSKDSHCYYTCEGIKVDLAPSFFDDKCEAAARSVKYASGKLKSFPKCVESENGLVCEGLYFTKAASGGSLCLSGFQKILNCCCPREVAYGCNGARVPRRGVTSNKCGRLSGPKSEC
jgi:hypothetical protein